MGIIAPITSQAIFQWPSVKEFGATGNGITNDTAAFKKAVESLPKEGSGLKNGGTIYVPPGTYSVESISVFELTGVHFLGAGGLQGGGGLGLGTSTSATVIILSGAVFRQLDFRKTVGCGASGIQFITQGAITGYQLDCEGAALNHFTDCCFTMSSSVAGTIREAPLVSLAKANGMSFTSCKFEQATYNVVGRTEAAVESHAHNFMNCWFASAQKAHVLNVHVNWNFDGCVFEGLIGNKGELLTQMKTFATGGAAFTAIGLALKCCSLANNEPATRTGFNIEYRGSALSITGCAIGTGELLLYFPAGVTGAHVVGNQFVNTTGAVFSEGNITNSFIANNVYETIGGIGKFTNSGLNIGSFIEEGEAGTSRIKGSLEPTVYGAKTERAINTEFEPSALRSTLVVLTIETKAATKTLVEAKVGGVAVATDDADASILANSKMIVSFVVPPKLKWELKVVEGTVEKLFSSYLPL